MIVIGAGLAGLACSRDLARISRRAPGDLTAVGPLRATHEPPLYLAGSDHRACGYMEGAVATGRAAARAVLGGEPIPLDPARSYAIRGKRETG